MPRTAEQNSAALSDPAALHVAILGGGTTSSAMALMAAHEVIRPQPAAAVWANTGAHSLAQMHWMERVMDALPFPVLVVGSGTLEEDALAGRCEVPYFTPARHGVQGCQARSCRLRAKWGPIGRAVLDLVREHGAPHAVTWVGIGADEGLRVKPARQWFAVRRWPLVEAGVTRAAAAAWLAQEGYGEAPDSACVFCAYRSDAQWSALRKEALDFERAAEFEEEYRARHPGRTLHGSGARLPSAGFRPGAWDGMFTNDCEGLCGT